MKISGLWYINHPKFYSNYFGNTPTRSSEIACNIIKLKWEEKSEIASKKQNYQCQGVDEERTLSIGLNKLRNLPVIEPTTLRIHMGGGMHAKYSMFCQAEPRPNQPPQRRHEICSNGTRFPQSTPWTRTRGPQAIRDRPVSLLREKKSGWNGDHRDRRELGLRRSRKKGPLMCEEGWSEMEEINFVFALLRIRFVQIRGTGIRKSLFNFRQGGAEGSHELFLAGLP